MAVEGRGSQACLHSLGKHLLREIEFGDATCGSGAGPGPEHGRVTYKVIAWQEDDLEFP